MSGTIRVKSLTSGISECDPIHLYDSPDGTRRLVFIPLIHNKPNKNGSVNGKFVYQRKRKADEWGKINIEGESLSKLKAGEGYTLDLPTDAVTNLISGLMDIDEIKEQVKSGRTNTTYLPTAEYLVPILNSLIENSSDEEIIKELFPLVKDNALRLNDLVLNARVKAALKYWEMHRKDNDEEAWQKFFNHRPWILALICAEPIIILEDKMYVGGTNASGKGGKTVDYGLINKQTNNTALLEIKTPVTPLLGSTYRGICAPSIHLNGSMVQVQNYKYNALKNMQANAEGYKVDFDMVNMPTYLLIGDSNQLSDKLHKRSFELMRRSLRDTTILTYDEIFERLKILLSR